MKISNIVDSVSSQDKRAVVTQSTILPDTQIHHLSLILKNKASGVNYLALKDIADRCCPNNGTK